MSRTMSALSALSHHMGKFTTEPQSNGIQRPMSSKTNKIYLNIKAITWREIGAFFAFATYPQPVGKCGENFDAAFIA